MLDDLFDDFPLHPSLRIPPLQDPLPSRPSGRPSPLEPSTRVDINVHSETSRLTGRRKAPVKTRPIEDLASKVIPAAPSSPKLRRDRDGNEDMDLSRLRTETTTGATRKKQKLYDQDHVPEFVQLPKPKAKIRETKPPPFQPVSILNELHEPPPSAALFPPITPSASQDKEDRILAVDLPASFVGHEDQSSGTNIDAESRAKVVAPRRNFRPRPKWTDAESDQIMKGVEIYGQGSWKKILMHPEFSFEEGRTSVDLKDRFRTCSQKKHRAQIIEDIDERSSNSGKSSITGTSTALPSRNKQHSVSKGVSLGLSDPPVPARRKAYQSWTDAEDENLAKGYQKYGFHWTKITKDQTLSLAHRTGPQVRDRFRLKYPELYGETKTLTRAPPEEPLEATSKLPPKTASNRRLSQSPTLRTNEGYEVFDRDDDEDDQRRRLSGAGDRHPGPGPPSGGIMGLLNDEEEDIRPASFRYYDWEESVTLPPLLWEDMATRPMFELE